MSAVELYDGFVTLEGGMDSGRAPELINPNQVSYAVNATSRGSYLRTRPPFRQPNLTFDSDESRTWFKSHRIQGADYFNLDGKTPVTISSVGGKIFEKRVNRKDAYVHDITPLFPAGATDITGAAIGGQVDRNSMRQPKVWMQQATNYFIIQDGSSKPIIYNGAKARRAGKNEVPVGECMAYGFGRIVVARGDELVVGDIVGGPTGVLGFTETTYLDEGGAFKLPADMGNITGMIFIARQDTATGQGNLLVFAEKGVASIDFSLPRDQWKEKAIQQVALLDIGATSAQSLTLINGDVFFRSEDGIRSYRDSRAQQDGYGRTPISYEVNEILNYDTPSLLNFVDAVYFDNRYLMTVAPKFNDYGAVFRGFCVMDFTPVTSTRAPAPPCFDGLWTGINPVALAVGGFGSGDRCFAYCTNDEGENQIWEILKKGTLDNDISPIEAQLDSRAFSFSDLWRYKNLLKGSLWIANLLCRTQFTVQFRSDQCPVWTDWQTFFVGQDINNCGERPICSPMANIPPQYRSGFKLKPVPEDCGTGVNKAMLKLGFTFQVRIKWRGNAAITRLLLKATDAPMLLEECSDSDATDKPILGCVGSSFTYTATPREDEE